MNRREFLKGLAITAAAGSTLPVPKPAVAGRKITFLDTRLERNIRERCYLIVQRVQILEPIESDGDTVSNRVLNLYASARIEDDMLEECRMPVHVAQQMLTDMLKEDTLKMLREGYNIVQEDTLPPPQPVRMIEI